MLAKILVLIAIIAAVFFAFKLISRAKAKQQDSVRDASSRAKEAPRRPGWARRIFKAEELVECPRCGTFVRSMKDHTCKGKT